ncbi:MAG: 16S rRNA (guanine(527)-N(7))-methyltransferase RsmG, partial [Lachnospiraceae bacterium]|nr:16S rRNA (guanine(527)-N(7))-methyltransferase RsmG [Lachnospiraceae bacterium]
IFFPEIQIVLLDSLQKRINFLQDVVSKLDLDGISCIHGRAEELSGKTEYRERFDYAVSRAVARLASLSELCVPFVKEGGQFLAYKSEGAAEEIDEAGEALSTLGCRKVEVLTYSIPQSDLPRKMVVATKTHATPAKYPRGGGKPMKQPIGVKK